MPRKKKQPETIKAEVTYSSKPEAPKEVPLIVPATTVPHGVVGRAFPVELEEKTGGKNATILPKTSGGVLINIPEKNLGRATRWICDSCGYINSKRDAYCQAKPDHCKAPKGNG